jgi:cytoskeletal protein CcmA (bactofilin family)
MMVVGLAFLCAVPVAFAETRKGESITISSEEIINEDLFIAGQDVRIEGEVNGDVYIAGDSISISGVINGDVLVVGGSIVVTGIISDDIRAIGESLTLEGATVNDGVSFLGERLVVGSDTEIRHGVLFAGEALVVDGVVNNAVRAVADTVVISGEVTESVHLVAREIRVSESAVINGDLTYRSENEATIASGAVIDGETIFTPEGGMMSELREGLVWLYRIFVMFSFFAILLTGLVLLLIFYRPTLLVSERINSKPLSTFGVGALALFASIPLFALLVITVVGIPLAFLFLSLFMVGLYISHIFVAVALGALIQSSFRRSAPTAPNGYLSFLIGLVVLYALYLLPVVGPLAVFFATCVGIGALVFALLRLRERTS